MTKASRAKIRDILSQASVLREHLFAMSTAHETTATTVSSLVASAEKSISQCCIPEAVRTLQEASHLDAADPGVQLAWKKVREASINNDAAVIDLTKQCLGDEQDTKLRQVWTSIVQDSILSAPTAQACLNLILNNIHTQSASTLLQRLVLAQKEARRFLAERIDASEELFKACLSTADEVNALVATLLDGASYTDPSAQATSQQLAFRRITSLFILASDEQRDRCLALLLRLVTHAGSKAADKADVGAISTVLTLLDIRLPQKTRTQALLIAVKLLEATAEKGEQAYIQFVVDRITTKTDDLITALSAAAAVFPVVPATSSKLFLTDGLIPRLVQSLDKGRVIDSEHETYVYCTVLSYSTDDW